MKYLLLLLTLTASAQTVINGGRTFLGPVDMTGATATKPIKSAVSAPATCTAAKDLYWNSTDGLLYKCALTPANTWEPLSAAGGSESTTAANSGATGAAVLKVGTNVTARKVIGTAPVTVTENTDDITLSWSLLTTKGDLAAFSTVPARLAIGTNDYVLTADSTAATGMAWKAPAGASGTGQIMNSLGAGSGVAQGQTYYGGPGFSIGSAEYAAVVSMPRAGTISKMYVHISSTQPASQSLTCTVRVAVAASAWNTAGTDQTAVQVVIAGNSAPGVYSDLTGTVSVAAGDKLSIGCAQQAGASASAVIRTISWEYL